MKRCVVLAILTVLAFTGVLLTLARAAEDITVGIQLFDKGQLAEARQFCESFVKEHPDAALLLMKTGLSVGPEGYCCINL